MQMQDITPGESWGCKFKVRTFIDDEGRPVSTRNVPIGGKVPGKPGWWESVGSIAVRDAKTRMVEIVDHQVQDRKWTVSWDDCWDIDRVEYVQEDK